jgi:hypothetical protein
MSTHPFQLPPFVGPMRKRAAGQSIARGASWSCRLVDDTEDT